MVNPDGKIEHLKFPKLLSAVTSNSAGTHGYHLIGDKPKIENSENICVAAELVNFKFYDNSRQGISEASFLGGQFDQSLRETEKLGTRPMLQADTVVHEKNGDIRLGLPFMILGNSTSKAAFVVVQDSFGQMKSSMRITDNDFTAEGRKYLDRNQDAITP